MNTLAVLWGDDNGKFGVCAIQPGSLLPACVSSGNYVNPPKGTPLWAISGGGYFSCGLTYPFRNPVCWGDGSAGTNATGMVLRIPLSYQSINYSSISAGGFHACAVRTTGKVDCWGFDGFNETIPPSDYSFTAVSAAMQFNYGLRSDDSTTVSWGHNLKLESPKNFAPDPRAQYSAIFTGMYHVCGIELNTKKALCWGINDDHRCDAPTNYTFSYLAAGTNHTCGLRDDNHEVICWGGNAYGQLIAPKGVPFSFISAADWYTCGVRRDRENQISCWGIIDGLTSQLVSSEGLCQGKCDENTQYYISNKCPTLTEKICMDCSKCLNGTSPTSQCGGTKDVMCISSPSPSPSSSSSSSPPSSPSPHPHRKLHAYIIVVAALGGIIILASLAGSLWCMFSKRKATWDCQNKIEEFSSAVLQQATSNYSDSMLVGRGASCLVYKGKLKDGRLIAVKKAINVGKSIVFEQELDLLRTLNHACLVNLVGYCKQEKILVFEFMENGSLFDCLFSRRSIQLDWKTRIKIASQASKGLEYLHIYACPTIIHRDVKSANVLLDKDWNAHIADFGISLLGPEAGDTHLSHTSAAGTPGYVDPEYIITMQLTTKSDVYSFGVVLLELLTGRKSFEPGDGSGILAWVTAAVQQGNIMKILDPTFILPADVSPLIEILELALKCVQRKPKERPTMVFVSHTLEKCLQGLAVCDAMSSTSPLLLNPLEPCGR